MKKNYILAIFIVLIITLIFRHTFGSAHLDKVAKKINVRTQLVHLQKASLAITANAEIKAKQSISLHAELSGLITALNCPANTLVHAGDVIVKLRSDELQAQLNSANATLHKDSLNFSRRSKLLASHYISQADIDNLQNTLEQDRAVVEEKQAQLAKTVIVAPFDGKLSLCSINTGAYITSGDYISTLESNSDMHVDFYIPESHIAMLHLNQPLTLTTPAFPNKIFTGKVTAIDNTIDTDNRSLHIQATVENPHTLLLSGMAAQVRLSVGEKNQMVVPETALTYDPESTGVFIVNKDNTVHRQIVRPGTHVGELVEIVEGLQPNEKIVTLGQQKLFDGALISSQNDADAHR